MKWLIGVLACLAVAGCSGGDEPRGLIAFGSDRDGDYKIFVMNADGTDVYSTGQTGLPWSWGG